MKGANAKEKETVHVQLQGGSNIHKIPIEHHRHLSAARKNEILENAAKKIQAQRFDFYLER